jgi:hypothetical protein
LPSFAKENEEFRYVAHNNGIFISPDDFEDEEVKVYDQIEQRFDMSDDLKSRRLQQITELGTVDYDTWWKIGSAMVSEGYTLADFSFVTRILRSHRNSGAKEQWAKCKTKSVSFGFVINLLKDRGIIRPKPAAVEFKFKKKQKEEIDLFDGSRVAALERLLKLALHMKKKGEL